MTGTKRLWAILLAGGVVVLAVSNSPRAVAEDKAEFTYRRHRMVDEQLKLRGIHDPKVLEALRKVRRHLFVDPWLRDRAYEDYPLPIGHGQTISQPYVVAYMTEAIEPEADGRVLEIGTGSGYQAAVLAEIVKEVYTIEIIEPLGETARKRLQDLEYENVFVRIGDGYKGWPDHAPFDAIVVTAAPDKIPEALIDQLKVGGRMILPIGSFFQDLWLVTKTEQGIEKKKLLPVRFVPMVKGRKD